MTLNLKEQQIDYIIRLGKQLEYQKVKREANALQEVKKLIDRSKEVIEKSRELEDAKHFIKECLYNMEHPDPPVDLGNGKVRVTLWKSPPEDYDYLRGVKENKVAEDKRP